MELIRALGALAESPAAEHGRIAELLGIGAAPGRAAFTELFVLQLPPYASIYTGEEGMLGGVARDRVAGFWRALGKSPPTEPDHLAALLGLYAALSEAQAAQANAGRSGTDADSDPAAAASKASHARAALFWEHLASWLPPYLLRVRVIAPPAFAAWADLLLATLSQEAAALGPPAVLPLHLRASEPLADLRDTSMDALAAALLVPVRAGLVLARADLTRISGDAGMAARIGERRFVLRTLLAHQPRRLLLSLADEALRQAAALQSLPTSIQPVCAFWAERAQSTAAALHAL